MPGSPRVWNKLPNELRQPVDDESLSPSSHLTYISLSSPLSSPLSLDIRDTLQSAEYDELNLKRCKGLRQGCQPSRFSRKPPDFEVHITIVRFDNANSRFFTRK